MKSMNKIYMRQVSTQFVLELSDEADRFGETIESDGSSADDLAKLAKGVALKSFANHIMRSKTEQLKSDRKSKKNT